VAYLAWSDIDIEGKTIKITSKPPAFIIKTKQERIVPLNTTAMDIIRDRHKVMGEGKWVFSDNGGPVKSAIKAVKTAARRAGIKKKVTPNMLRHFFATHAIMGGADIKHLSAVLGHSSLETTAKYLHSIDGQLRKTVDIVGMSQSAKYGSKNGSK
jgi:integrase